MQPTIREEAHRLLQNLEPTCEHKKPEAEQACSAEADWMLRVSCGDSALFCDGHQEETKRHLGEGETALYCGRHGGRRVLYDWIAF